MPRARDGRARKEPLTAEKAAHEQQKIQKSRETATKRRQKKHDDATELLRNARDLETVHNAMLKNTVQQTLDEQISLCTMALGNENIPLQLKGNIREMHQRALNLKSGGFFGVDVPNHLFPWTQEPNRRHIGKQRVDIAIDFKPINSETAQVVVRPSQEEPPSSYMAASSTAHSLSMPAQSTSATHSQLTLPSCEPISNPWIAEVKGSSPDSQLSTQTTPSQGENQTLASLPWAFIMPILPGLSDFRRSGLAAKGPVLSNIFPSSSDTSSLDDDDIPRLDDGHEMCSDGLINVGEFDQVPVFCRPDTSPEYSMYDGKMILQNTQWFQSSSSC